VTKRLSRFLGIGFDFSTRIISFASQLFFSNSFIIGVVFFQLVKIIMLPPFFNFSIAIGNQDIKLNPLSQSPKSIPARPIEVKLLSRAMLYGGSVIKAFTLPFSNVFNNSKQSPFNKLIII